MSRRLALIAACALAIQALTACTTDQERCAQSAKPAECMQVSQAGGDISDYLMYGMAGYMLANAVNGSGQRQPVIVADPNYHGQRRAIASYSASPGRVHRQTVTTTKTKRGIFGGTKTTTRTSSWSSRSSSRSSSFSSRRR